MHAARFAARNGTLPKGRIQKTGTSAHIVYTKGRKDMDLRKKAVEKGLEAGRKIRYHRRKGNGEDHDYISRGVVEGLFRYIFTVRMEVGYVVSFRYNELLGRESEGRVSIV